MSRKGSYIAAEIDKDYRREQFYKKRKRQTCKEIQNIKQGRIKE